MYYAADAFYPIHEELGPGFRTLYLKQLIMEWFYQEQVIIIDPC